MFLYRSHRITALLELPKRSKLSDYPVYHVVPKRYSKRVLLRKRHQLGKRWTGCMERYHVNFWHDSPSPSSDTSDHSGLGNSYWPLRIRLFIPGDIAKPWCEKKGGYPQSLCVRQKKKKPDDKMDHIIRSKNIFENYTSYRLTYRIYIMTPRDHMSQDLSYFSGPRTSGAANVSREII